MKKLALGLMSLALTITACTPTAGVPPVKYVGESSEIIAAISQVCTKTQPNRYYNFYTVDAITNNGVTCVAKPVLGFQILVTTAPIRVTFTALQNGKVVNVAGSVAGSGGDGRQLVDEVFKQLDKSYQRVQ